MYKYDYGFILLGLFLYKESYLNAENRSALCAAGTSYEENVTTGPQNNIMTFESFDIPNDLENRKEITLEESINLPLYDEQIFLAVVYSNNDTKDITIDNVLEQTELQYGVLCTITLYKCIIGAPFRGDENHF